MHRVGVKDRTYRQFLEFLVEISEITLFNRPDYSMEAVVLFLFEVNPETERLTNLNGEIKIS